MLNGSSHVGDNSVSSVSLYFPSNTKFGNITDAINSGMTTVTEHKCNIERDNRYIWDSNWNLIGVPGYIDLKDISDPASVSADKLKLEGGQYPVDSLSFYYAWNPSSNKLSVSALNGTQYFNSLYCYMVQFAGTINWSTGVLTPAAIAARRVDSEAEKESYTLDLHVSQAGSDADHTYVRLQDNATESYDMNIDLVKADNAGATNLYTIVDEVNMGANCLPVPASTTIVPVGITAAANAEYTFSLPEGTDGMNVSLIDYETGSQTNLALGDYAVSLPQGTYDSRFALVINRRQVVTDIEAAEGGMMMQGAEKVVIDGILYIRNADGSVYDAQGKRVR